MFSGPCLRDVSARSRCHIPTPPVLQGAGTVVWTRPIRRAVFSGPEGRTPEDLATPHRTDLMVTNHLTCRKDTVSYSLVLTQKSQGKFCCSSRVSVKASLIVSKQSRERRCRARCTSSTRRQVSAPGTTPGYPGMFTHSFRPVQRHWDTNTNLLSLPMLMV